VTGARVPDLEQLGQVVVGRSESFLSEDLRAYHEALHDGVAGARVLVVGGAGSIGSSTVRQLAALRPAQLHVVDPDENGLAELVRDLRSAGAVAGGTELVTTPLDAGSPTMRRMLRERGGYDLVLDFAAVKHVRSEKDVYSLLRMMDVNLRLPSRLMAWVQPQCRRFFAVSTDKAANPVSLMGASKRAMEQVLLDDRFAGAVTSARFANVAFSQGSLLAGWLQRLAKGQPLAVPADTRRWFVTLEESGQLCLLAAVLGQDREVVVPDLDPATELHDLVDVAERVLASLGLRPVRCSDEDEARAAAADIAPGTWPLLVTRRDTAGEKEEEEFVAPGDVVREGRFARLRGLEVPVAARSDVDALLAELDLLLDDPEAPADAAQLTAMVARLVPELTHYASALSLDQRM
jgi:FlaA1/EpsC-like NDP-sugar epimerase